MSTETAATPPLRGRPATYVGWLIGERLVRTSVTIAALAVVARHLGPAEFGLLNLALTLIGIVMPLAQLGLDAAVVRELVRAPHAAGQILGTASALRLAAGVVCAALLFAASRVADLGVPASVIAPLCLMLIAQAAETPELWFRSQVQSRPTTIARTVAVVGAAIAKLLLAAAGAGLVTFAWVTVAEVAAFELGLWYFYRRKNSGAPTWSWNAARARRLLNECWWYAIAATLGGIAFRIDQLFVATYLGDAAAGQYFAALRLLEIPTFVAVSVATALFPTLAATGSALGDGRYQTILATVMAIGWAAALSTSLLGGPVMLALFGEPYAAASLALVVRGWALLPLFSALVRTHWLTVIGAARAQFLLVLAGFVLQLALNALLLPRYGLTGAALAFLITELCGAWLVPWLIRDVRPTLRAQMTAWLLPFWPPAWRRMLVTFTRQG